MCYLAALLLQMWRYEGQKTLAYYLRRRDCIAALAEDLGVDQAAVVATVMKQVLGNIAVSTAHFTSRCIQPAWSTPSAYICFLETHQRHQHLTYAKEAGPTGDRICRHRYTSKCL